MTAPVQVGPSPHSGGPGPSTPRLTPRHLQILHLAANGCTNKEIGRRLGITEDTVKSHMAVILRLLHVEDRTQAVAVGIRLKLISLDTITVSPRPQRGPRRARTVTASPPVEELDEELADIGDRIRAERQARGWSQAELARRALFDANTLRRLESGRGTFLSALVLACRALEVDIAYVLSADWRLPERAPGLSPRQVEVLRAATSGDSLARLAGRLRMTVPAVGSHLSRIYVQLGVTHVPRGERRAAAVRVAVEHGLIDPQKRTS